ncbi:MAG: cupredoxin domain-containing protein [Actinomycetota bacterium]
MKETGGKHMRAKLVVFIGALAMIASACNGGGGNSGGGGDSGESQSGGTITLGGLTANDQGTFNAAGKARVEVEMDDFYFSPTVVEGNASQLLVVDLTNASQSLHNFSNKDLGIDVDVKPGDTADVRVTFGNVLDAISVFECKYHASQGMRMAVRVPR